MLTIVGMTLLAGYSAVAVAAFSLQRSIIFPVPPEALQPKRMTLLRLSDSVVAIARPAREGQPTVAFFHGNAVQLADAEWLGDQLAELGIGFFAVEFPGYGLAAAAGGPSEQGCYSAAEIALTFLEKSTPRGQIVLLGQSLGTGVAVEMAARGHGSKLILVTPYTSIPQMAAELFWFLPTRLLVRDSFDNLGKAKRLSLPVLIIHGTADEVVPTRMGQALAKEFPRAELMRVEGAHHNDLIDRSEVLIRIADFARR